MSLLAFLLFPTVCTVASDLRINDYLVRIEDDTLKSIQTTETSHSELNLSNRRLRSIEGTAFVNLTNLKSLSLANNALVALPEFGFAELKNLENLTLANNNITDFINAFAGLGRLRSLDITNNPLRPHWNSSMFLGLKASCDIWTRGTFPRYLMASAFHSYSPDNETLRSVYVTENIRPSAFVRTIIDTTKYQLCIQDGVVQTLEKAPRGRNLEKGCIKIVHPFGHFDLRNFRIRDFNESWYLVNHMYAASIDIGWNNIEGISKGMLNNFPKKIVNVNLTWNKIEGLEKDVIDNRWIQTLDLSNNLISVIEDGALKNTRVTTLILTGNRLRDIIFAASLPNSVLYLRLDQNEINAIAPRSFSKANRIVHLNLGGNRISELRNGSLSGVPRLTKLNLHENHLRRIEPGAFHHDNRLTRLDLCCNSLVAIEKDVFAGFSWILQINLRGNRLSKITRDFLADVPNNFLQHVDLSFNDIESVEAGSFTKVPRVSLLLSHNRITRIEKGTFGLLGQERSNLKATTTVQSFENTFSDSVSGLWELFLDGNKIERLERGALFGMERSSRTVVNLSGTDVEFVQPGVFDDL